MALLPAIAALFVLVAAGPAPAQPEGGPTARRTAPAAAPAPQMQASRGRRGIAARRASARRARGMRTRVGLGTRGRERAPRAGRVPSGARAPSRGTRSPTPPSYEREPSAATFWRTVGPYWAAILMAALYLVLLFSFRRAARLRSILLAPLLVFAFVIVLCVPLGYWAALILMPYLFVLLSLWNWVRTRRLGLLLLLLLATALVFQVATAGSGGIIHWPYPTIMATLGVAMLLIRLWPRWRLLKSPLPERAPPRTSVARGVLDSYAWPRKNAQGVTTVSVLIAFVMVLVVASAAVSCLARAAQVSRRAQRSFVATTLLEGEFERLRAGAVTVAEVERDLSLRASRLLPNAGARAGVARGEAADLLELDLEVSWQETGRPRRTAGLAGLVYTGG